MLLSVSVSLHVLQGWSFEGIAMVDQILQQFLQYFYVILQVIHQMTQSLIRQSVALMVVNRRQDRVVEFGTMNVLRSISFWHFGHSRL